MALRKHGTLTANTAATVTVTGSAAAVRVTNFGTTDPLYLRMDGTAATVAGDDTYSVAPGQHRFVKVQDRDESLAVSLICNEAAKYSVELVDPVGAQWWGS